MKKEDNYITILTYVQNVLVLCVLIILRELVCWTWMFKSIDYNSITCHITSIAKMLQLWYSHLVFYLFILCSLHFLPLYGLGPSYVFGTIDLATINNVFILHSFVVCSYVYVLSIWSTFGYGPTHIMCSNTYLDVIKHIVIVIVMQAINLMATSSRKQRPSWTKNIRWKKLLSLEVIDAIYSQNKGR
jgi:hypothetical protein